MDFGDILNLKINESGAYTSTLAPSVCLLVRIMLLNPM